MKKNDYDPFLTGFLYKNYYLASLKSNQSNTNRKAYNMHHCKVL